MAELQLIPPPTSFVSKKRETAKSKRLAKRFLRKLEFDPKTASEDFPTTADMGSTINQERMKVVKIIMKRKRLRNFLLRDFLYFDKCRSDLLLINGGDLRLRDIKKVLSLLSANIADMIQNTENTIPIYFLHEGTTTPETMMVSLVCRLLTWLFRKTTFDLNLWKVWKHHRHRDDLKALCQLFSYLVKVIPSGHVVVVFINALELSDDEGDSFYGFLKAVEQLIQTAKDGLGEFKLVLTCWGGLGEIQKYFDKVVSTEILTISRNE